MFKNWLSRSVQTCISLLALFLAPFASVEADDLQRYSSAEHGLSFSYPSDLKPEKVDLPQSVVALKGADQGYPSFNILVSAETFDPKGYSEDSYRDKVLSDYRAVGITDAKGVRTYSAPVANQMVYTSEIRYQYKGEALLSSVTLLPAGENKHYILTYIDQGEHFYRRKRAREEIVNSLKLGRSGEDSGDEETVFGGESSSAYWLKLLLFTLAGCLLAVVVFRKRAKS